MSHAGARVALYLRVSTDDQTVANQQRELETVVQRHGWTVVGVFSDEGISGTHGRDKRPALDRLLQGVTRRDFDIVAAWSVDRLGRSLRHLLDFLGELKASGVDLYLHQQGVDTRTPAGRALFQMLGVFAEFERAIIVERINAGLRRARAMGTKSGKAIGRPRVQVVDLEHAQLLKGGGLSLRAIAKALGVHPMAVARALGGGVPNPGRKPLAIAARRLRRNGSNRGVPKEVVGEAR